MSFLLTTEIIPLSLRIMETGQELSRTVATFVLHKILVDEAGLVYICSTYDRFSHVAMILVSPMELFVEDVGHASRPHFPGSDGDWSCQEALASSAQTRHPVLLEVIRKSKVSKKVHVFLAVSIIIL